jgi:hypothetical protein
MMDERKICGCTESQVVADARTLGLLQEFQSGIYTCCQIADWAHEQWSAWVQATQEDAKDRNDVNATSTEVDETEAVLVPVRFRRPVPWFRRT